MSALSTESVEKLKNDIRLKLAEIGAYVDNELPDYIMVMVSNQKSKYQMKDDLSLFLEKNTDEFVDWLHDAVKNIDLKTADPPVETTKRKVKSSQNGSSASVTLKKGKKRRRSSDSESKESSEKKRESKRVTRRRTVKKSEEKKDVVNHPKDENVSVSEQVPVQHEEGDVVLMLNSENVETDELLQEAVKPEETLESSANGTLLTAKSNGNLQTSASTPPASLISHNEPPQKKNIPSTETKIVSSVVKVSERKPIMPPERETGRSLIGRALKDVQKPVLDSNIKRRSDKTSGTSPVAKRFRDNLQKEQKLDSFDLRHVLQANRQQTGEFNSENTSRNLESEMEENDQDSTSPKFVVTLDGVKSRLGPVDKTTGDELTFEAEVDEEFVEAEDSTAVDENEGSNKKLTEKCKYWPSCKNGDDCGFYHPTVPCKTFPNCRFGDKCLYIHPTCKYDAMCAKSDCPFAHSVKKLAVGSFKPAGVASATPCKFFPNCINPSCPFLHPKVCAFGAKCRNPNCSFTHTPTYPASLPKPHQFRWNAKEHFSERKFAESESTQLAEAEGAEIAEVAEVTEKESQIEIKL